MFSFKAYDVFMVRVAVSASKRKRMVFSGSHSEISENMFTFAANLKKHIYMVETNIKNKEKKNDSDKPKPVDYSLLPDKELVDFVCNNDRGAIKHLFTDSKYVSIIDRHCRELFRDGEMELHDCVNEIYIYLQKENDGKEWARLRQYEGRNGAKLSTWLSGVAWNFLIKKKERMIREWERLNKYVDEVIKNGTGKDKDENDLQKAVRETLNKMPNLRYRSILIRCYIIGRELKDVAKEDGIDIKYFYVLHDRAKKQFETYYHYQSIFYKYHYEEMKPEEIAKEMRISIEEVYTAIKIFREK
jgi:DNA-directed RNA polymerase specialized sigma24 family protein